MIRTILSWLGFSQSTEIEKVEPQASAVYSEEELSILTKSQLKTIGEEEFKVQFKSNDRKSQMVMRIIAAQN
jgi:hypothetical protein